MPETTTVATEGLPPEYRVSYDPALGGCAVTAIYRFPNGRRASVMRSHDRDTYEFWDFNPQTVPTADGLTLGEVLSRLAEAQTQS